MGLSFSIKILDLNQKRLFRSFFAIVGEMILKKIFTFILLSGFIIPFFYYNHLDQVDKSKILPYGVFIGISPQEKYLLENYQIVVIDGQYFSKEDITELKNKGKKIYSYLNIGSIEDFRPYFSQWKDNFLGNYENWEEEYWMDVSNSNWQDYIVKTLAKNLIDKGIDGFFVDNFDVYYNYQQEKIYHGLEEILKNLKFYNKPVIINGGDYFIQRYLQEHEKIFFDGISQENVFTSIDFKHKQFYKQNENVKKYYLNYLDICQRSDLKIFLLEYGKNKDILNEIKQYCDEKGYSFYYSSSLELNK